MNREPRWQTQHRTREHTRVPWSGVRSGIYKTQHWLDAFVARTPGSRWEGRAWVEGILVYDSERKNL